MAINLGDALISIKTAFDDKDFHKKITGIGDVAAGLGKVFAITAAAASGIGAAALAFAGAVDNASKKAAASLGLPTAEAEKFGDVIRAVYGDNFGESIGAVGAAVTTVASQFKHLGITSTDAIKKATEDAFRLQDAYSADVSESINAAAALVSNLGLSSEEAMDFISAGFQRGLDSSGDFLDSISEYAVQFGSAGADAGQFFSVLETGLQGGVLGTDKAADMFKEFTVRIQDGSDTTAASLKAIGINSNLFLHDLSTGQLSVADAFELVHGKLQLTNNQATLMQAGVGLLGTQFEDLGVKAALSVDMQKTKFAELAGSTGLLDGQYDTLSNSMSTIWRQTLLLIEPIGQALIPHLKALGSYIAELIPRFNAWIMESGIVQKATDYLSGVIQQHVIPAVESFMQHLPELIETLSIVGQTFIKVGGYIADAFGAIHDAWRYFWDEMAPGMIGGFETMIENVKGFVDSIVSGFTSLRDRAKAIWDAIVSVITSPIDTIMGVFSTFDSLVDSLMGHSTIPAAFTNLYNSAATNFSAMNTSIQTNLSLSSISINQFADDMDRVVRKSMGTQTYAFIVSEETLRNLNEQIEEMTSHGQLTEYQQSILTIITGQRDAIKRELKQMKEDAKAELEETSKIFKDNFEEIEETLDDAVGNSWMPELLGKMSDITRERTGEVRGGFAETAAAIRTSLEDVRDTITKSALIEMPDAMGIAEDSLDRFRDTAVDRLWDVQDAVYTTELAFAAVGNTAQKVALNSALEFTRSAELISNSTLQIATEQALIERSLLRTTDLTKTVATIKQRIATAPDYTTMMTTGHYNPGGQPIGPVTIQVQPGMDERQLALEVRRQLRELQMQTAMNRNRR